MNFHQLALLLKTKLQIARNSFLRGSGKRRARSWLALLGGGVFFLFIFNWIYEILSSLQAADGVRSGLVENFILITLLGFFFYLFIIGNTLTLHYLFIATDLPLLMSSPISNRTIFSAKLIEAIFANSSLFFFMAIPVFISYGMISSAQWYYYPLMLIVAVLFLAVPICLAFLSALVIAKIIQPSRARELLAVILGVASLLLWLALQSVRASSFDRNSADFNPDALLKLQQVSHYEVFNHLPSTWAARSLFELANGNLRLVVLDLLPLLLVVASLFYLAIQLSHHVFREGFIIGAATMRLKKKVSSRSTLTASAQPSRSLISGVAGSVLRRDLRLLVRDTRHFISIAMLGVMMVIIAAMQQRNEPDPEIATWSGYIFIILFSGILAGHISSRLIPIESKSFWITKLVPQPALRIIAGKFSLAWLLSMGITWVAVIFHAVRAHDFGQLVAVAFIITSCITAACCALGLYIASHFARFDWDHPKRMLSPAASPILGLAALALTAMVIAIYGFGVELQISTEILLWLLVGAVVPVCLIIALVALLGAAQKIQKTEWEF
ncbi:MAG: hypothetical protein ONB13_09790 [candidate division KSB1 bacterium]|nr:hypothetical protein [candidate division KSB1 bacterium]MDZ7334776.1 hypothetical protein [candidate division KSB1 bacterium]MDZ7357172.1 hypothetical protein [candidate division KSB1 bacterium]MDZ7376899.1 hypothetical protein [candidate division KSB1 bacterium]MDZ7398580.1 hypothetical protein [candidate division KSB1 bacterium]